MTIQSIAIVSETPITQKQDLVYIQSFSSKCNASAIGNETVFEEDLFGFDVSDYLNQDQEGGATGSLCSLRHQFLLHSALELFGNASKDRNSTSSTHSALFIGFICALDDFRFYGYRTNTGVKIIVSVKDDILPSKHDSQKARDDYIESALVQIHSTYVEYMMNPFNAKQGSIRSKRFQQQIDQIASM